MTYFVFEALVDPQITHLHVGCQAVRDYNIFYPSPIQVLFHIVGNMSTTGIPD